MIDRFENASPTSLKEECVQGALEDYAASYLEMPIGKQLYRSPFWMNWDGLYKDTPDYRYIPGGGKMSARQIQNGLMRHAPDINTYGITAVARREGIGVDCSGFVYGGLQRAHLALGGRNFEECVTNENGQTGISKIGVSQLALEQNSLVVPKIQEIKPADFIIMGSGHVVLVLGRMDRYIHCVHASNEIQDTGVNYFPIKVRDFGEDIRGQEWKEVGMDGINYNDGLLRRIRRCEVRRLHTIDEMYK